MHEDEGRLQLRLKKRTDQLADSPKTWESLYRRLPFREHYISNFHSLNSFTEGQLSEKLISLWKKKWHKRANDYRGCLHKVFSYQVQEFELCATCLGGQISRRQFLGTCPLKLPLPHYNFFCSIRALWLFPRPYVFFICSQNLFSWCVFHASFFSAMCFNKMHLKHIPIIEPTLMNSDTHHDTDHNQNDCNGNGNAHHDNDNVHESTRSTLIIISVLKRDLQRNIFAFN